MPLDFDFLEEVRNKDEVLREMWKSGAQDQVREILKPFEAEALWKLEAQFEKPLKDPWIILQEHRGRRYSRQEGWCQECALRVAAGIRTLTCYVAQPLGSKSSNHLRCKGCFSWLKVYTKTLKEAFRAYELHPEELGTLPPEFLWILLRKSPGLWLLDLLILVAKWDDAREPIP